jgi:hypothetical protein
LDGGDDMRVEKNASLKSYLTRVHASMENNLYWIQPGSNPGTALIQQGRCRMTYLDVVFRYVATPGETELQAIDGMREVYGIRGVQFNEAERTVRVGYDASRLKADAVAKLLRQAGIDVREQLALA